MYKRRFGGGGRRVSYGAIRSAASLAARKTAQSMRRAGRRTKKIPMWAWLLAVAAVVYYFFKDKIMSLIKK